MSNMVPSIQSISTSIAGEAEKQWVMLARLTRVIRIVTWSCRRAVQVFHEVQSSNPILGDYTITVQKEKYSDS
jgi:hypothetical protein